MTEEKKTESLEAEVRELKAQAKKDAATIASLSAQAARATAEAETLKKLFAHGGPHDPVTKYD